MNLLPTSCIIPCMELPTIQYGDEDEKYSGILSERRLYLAIFTRSIQDLFSPHRMLRKHAIQWFRGKSGTVTFEDVKQVLNFKASRLEKIKEYVNGDCPLGGLRLSFTRVRKTLR